MTIGVGGSNAQNELSQLENWAANAAPIQINEFNQRIEKACELMRQLQWSAIYLDAGTNLYYFTGTRWWGSERMVGALLTSNGDLHYIAPAFEIGTIQGYMQVPGEVHGWQEHESPYRLFANLLEQFDITETTLGLDESTAFFISNGLAKTCPTTTFVDAKNVTAACRSRKSKTYDPRGAQVRCKDFARRDHH